MLARLWIGVVLLAVALAPTADAAAGRSTAGDAADLLLVAGGGLLLGHGARWAFGQPDGARLRRRTPLLGLAAVIILVAVLIPLTFAQQAMGLVGAGLGGYAICTRRAT
jgi:hypothetical protein